MQTHLLGNSKHHPRLTQAACCMFCEHWPSFESRMENNMLSFTTSIDLKRKEKITHSRAMWLSSNPRCEMPPNRELSFKSDSVAMRTSTHSQTRPLPFPVLTAFRGNMQRVSVSCWRWAYHGCLFMIRLNAVWQSTQLSLGCPTRIHTLNINRKKQATSIPLPPSWIFLSLITVLKVVLGWFITW